MSKLYLFGIGGTGSRVIRSLVMLLASGVNCGSTETIVPVIIDPDVSNGDVTRTVGLLNLYQRVHAGLNFGEDVISAFYKTALDDSQLNFRLPLANVSNKTFSQFIDFQNLDKNNEALASYLFSDDNLASTLDVGFRGNPNMGSIVLNDFNSNSMKQILSNFQQSDRIFIISSIFGGTGAAGFPLLVKTLRTLKAPAFTSAAYINNAPIGAITVLPYFGLQSNNNGQTKVQMQSFISKTKSALTYYQDNLDVDTLYYITDKLTSRYAYSEGTNTQKNNAHFVELAAALSIIDFINSNAKHGIGSKSYKEFAIDQNADPIYLTHLSSTTQAMLDHPLIQMYLFAEYYVKALSTSLESAWAKGIVDNSMLSTQYYKDVHTFLSNFLAWLDEMKHNTRSFEPFNFEAAKKDILRSINGVTPAKLSFMQKLKGEGYGYSSITGAMADVSNNLQHSMNINDYFMSVFYGATKQIIKKYNL